ncbi:uroporphyrinogen-III decarboxylase-like protein [Candidatus Vecturithrix granuli]|uniref:Uroporphyrinogen-III decarboxylase-like protein n=1 Tax=Vecturithrix granuli TaxID=1499967 RepID=A0A0S6W9K6_VECG1|nr:uroporphyrinogen-III decarboxylase-like protein [Candidatus Vecturithrix granuli]
MNSFERYLGILQGQRVDFLPRLPILMQFAAEYIGSNYGEFASDYHALVEANARCAEDFGMDQLSAISDPFRETQGFGAEIVYVKDGVPRCPHPPLEASKELATLVRPNPLQSERMLDRVKAIQSFKERFDGQYSILGWIEGPTAEATDLRSMSNFFVDLIEDKPFAAKLMDLCVEVGVEFAKAQIDAGADTIGIGDAAASQVSPRVYQKLILPRQKRLIQAVKDLGAFVRLHICGNITHLLPGIAELNIDILDVDHSVDMAAVRQALGKKVVLAGNIDPVSGVLRGTPATIRETMVKTYHTVGNPYMITAGCEIPSGTPVDNLKALCEPIPCRP